MPSAGCTSSPTIRRQPASSPDVHPDDGPLPLDLHAFGRWLAFLAIFALIGTCVFATLIPRWRGPRDDDRSLAARALHGAWQVAVGATGVLLLAHFIRAWGQVHSFLDPGEALTWEAARPVLLSTAWGRGWLAQVSAATLALPIALTGRRWPHIGLALLGTAVLLIVAAAPFTGHSVENPWGRQLGIGLHALHLLGGGVWLGSLFTMLIAGLRAARTSGQESAEDAWAVARMVRTFSPVALAGAAMATGAGALLAFAYIGDLTSLLNTRYGQTLLVKLALLALTLALGAWNWRRVVPRLGTPESSRELRRSAMVELTFGGLLLVATAVLVALPAPKV